jgi:hypothetical protein
MKSLEKFQFTKLDSKELTFLVGGTTPTSGSSSTGTSTTSSKSNDRDSNAGDADSNYTDSGAGSIGG